ncbi:MAG: urease accessory protein [Oleispira sp.]
MQPQKLDPNLHWLANYQAQLAYLDGKTRLGKTSHFGPLRVQRAFYPEGDICAHLYLLHPPGGLVAGDYLTISLHLQPHAQALMTTPSAGKIYNNITERKQFQKVSLKIEEGAVLEWMPQETLVFDGAEGELITEIELHGKAQFMGWDIVCLGRPSSEDWFERGSIRQVISIQQDGQPLFIERNSISADGDIMRDKAGLAQQAVFGSFILTNEANTIPELEEEQREVLEALAALTAETGQAKGLVAVTHKPGLVIVRYLGPCADNAKKVFIKYWQWMRPFVNGREACAPRIWNT